jgi:hypothetical protein
MVIAAKEVFPKDPVSCGSGPTFRFDLAQLKPVDRVKRKAPPSPGVTTIAFRDLTGEARRFKDLFIPLLDAPNYARSISVVILLNLSGQML